MKRIFLFTLLSICSLHAQNIKRKGSLGVGFYQVIPDSLQHLIQNKSGALINRVFPNTTSEKIGVLKNDLITKVNSSVISNPKDLIFIAKSLRENEAITVELFRKNERLILKGNVIAKPKETSTTADVIYGEFPYKKGFVRTIYKTLKGKKPLGTIFFLQGLPCYSMDNFQDLDITKQAIDAMVEQGFAVYRMEKGDMGDNTGLPPCETMGYHEELSMYEAGYKHLLTLKEVDKQNIFLFGHSMGGTTAPLLAEKFQPRGVVVYGTLFKPWLEYLCDTFIYQPQYYGEDLGKLRIALEKYKPYFYDYFYGKKTIEEVTSTDEGLTAFQELLNYDKNTQTAASGRHIKTFKELNECHVSNAWGNYQNDVLAIYGECDIAANNADDHKKLIEYINLKRPGKGTFWLAEKTTHTFEEIGTMEEFIKLQSNPQAYYQYAATKFNSKVFDYTCDWMKSILKKQIN